MSNVLNILYIKKKLIIKLFLGNKYNIVLSLKLLNKRDINFKKYKYILCTLSTINCC